MGRLKERVTMSGDRITTLTWIKHEVGGQDIRLSHMMALYGAAGYAYYWLAVEYLAQWGGTLPYDSVEACLPMAWGLNQKEEKKAHTILAELIKIGLLAQTDNGDVYCPLLKKEFADAVALRDIRSKAVRARWEK